MAEVEKLKEFLRAEEEQEDEEEEEDDEDRVREWEEGLPSLVDLISLSQCLISPQLASAFSITSPSPSPARSSTDVALASRAAFSSLRRPLRPYPDLPPSSAAAPQLPPLPLPPSGGVIVSHADNPRSTILGSHVTGSGIDTPHADNIRGFGENRGHGDGISLQEKGDDSQRVDDEQIRGHGRDPPEENSAAQNRGYGAGLVQKYQDCCPPIEVDGDDLEGRGEKSLENGSNGCMQVNASQPCTTEGSNAPIRADAAGETEEAESNASPPENANGEASARTLKRPRRVWTPELHKRFVDAVTYLGVRTAVPKTIMQLMNVEGLTRENVASHLQKYRLYLKRMQRHSSDVPASSDHLFMSTALPGNPPAPGRFQSALPAHVQDVNQVAFIASPNPVSMTTGHVAGVMHGPLPPMDPYYYNVFTRPPHRLPSGDMLDVQRVMHHPADSMHHVPRN